MAFYTNNVKTRIYNSVFDASNYRSEFRLDPDTLYLSNMRILNLGLTAATIGDGRYNLINGVGSVIKSIFLYDGSVQIDGVVNYADYSAFQAYNKSNQYNTDVGKLLLRNGLGFCYEREPVVALPDPPNPDIPQVQNNLTIKENFLNAPHKPRVVQENTPMGFLDLTKVFPILKGEGGLQYLHTGLFKNLRIVIEYNVTGSVVEAIPVLAKTTLPILVADSIEDGGAAASNWLSSFKQQTWVAVESESVSVPFDDTVDPQSLKLRLTGALGKTVNTLLIQKKGTTHVSQLYGNHGSETMAEEAIQLFCNGSSILPESGISRPNERLALLHDTFSELNSHTCSNELPMLSASNFVEEQNDRCGRLDYFGCIINKKVSSLDLSYSRSLYNGYADRYKQPLTLNIFYGVVKVIVKDTKGGYNVLYL